MSLPAQHIPADTEALTIVGIIGVELDRAVLLSYGHEQPDDSIVYFKITKQIIKIGFVGRKMLVMKYNRV